MGQAGDEQEPGRALPAPAACLQPRTGEIPQLDESDLDDAAAPEMLERLRRLEGDERLVQAMREQNFSGRLYRNFEGELIAYALEVLQAWMYTGQIFSICSNRGLAMTAPSPQELELFAHDRKLRADIASMSVGLAIPAFKKSALIAGGWQRDGGASLTTYFVGATLYYFRNERRRELLARVKNHRNTATALRRSDRSALASAGVVVDGDAAELLLDPGVTVPKRAVVDEALNRATARQRAIIALTLDGYTQPEIVEVLGEKSVRAVEGVLARWRKGEQSRWSNIRRSAREEVQADE